MALKFLSALVGISKMDMPRGVAMVMVPKTVTQDQLVRYARLSSGFITTFVGSGHVKLQLAEGKGSENWPADMVQSILFVRDSDTERDVVAASALISALLVFPNGGREYVDVLLGHRKALLERLALYAQPVVKQLVSVLDERSVQVGEQPQSVEVIIQRADPGYLWELYLCVMCEQPNPVATFSLPDVERRRALKVVCKAKTGVGYNVFSQPSVYGAVAAILEFPKFETKSVTIAQVLSGSGLEEVFFDDLDPVVTALEDEFPRLVYVQGKCQRELTQKDLMLAKFEGGVSLFGWRHRAAANSVSPADMLDYWQVPVVDGLLL